jgi:hypothetical protein
MRVTGQPGATSEAELDSEETGKPETSPTGPLKDARVEETRSSIAGQVGGCRIRGNPETHREAELEKRGDGATRSFTYRAAEGCENRGDSKLHRRHSLKIEDSGRPGDSLEG